MNALVFAFLIWIVRSVPPARPVNKLVVDWWTMSDLAAVAKVRGTCSEAPSEAMEIKAELLACPNADPHLNEKAIRRMQCVVKSSRTLPLDLKGTFELEDAPPGTHYVRFAIGSAPPLWKLVRVHGEGTTNLSVELSWFSFHGKVTRKGEPMYVQVYYTVTDRESGEYVAYLPREPGAYVQRIVPCKGGDTYWFVPEEAPAENARFDIEIRVNRVLAEVVDADTGEPLAGARVSHAALRTADDGAPHYSGPDNKTDAKGVAVLEPLVPKHHLRVCAEHERYERRCTETFTMAADETKTLRLALDKVIRREGRVFANGKIELGQVYWYARSGELAESLYVEEDGRFAYKRKHVPGEIVVFTSPAHPMYAFPMPPLEEEQPFHIQLPQARVRSVEVHLAPTAAEGVFFTIALGDLILPGHPLTQHLARRGQSPSLMPGATTVIADIFETAPLSVIVAPFSYAHGRAKPPIEMFLLPEARSLPRKVVGEATRVTFE